MANWVMNELRVSGSRETVSAVKEKLFNGKGEFSLAVLVPEERDKEEWYIDPRTRNLHPEENGRADGKVFNWYDFRSSKWGPSWDAGESEVIEDTPCRIHLRYETAWSSCRPWVAALRAAFPEATVEYGACDPAMDWYVKDDKVFLISDLVDYREAKRKALQRFFDDNEVTDRYDIDAIIDASEDNDDIVEWYDLDFCGLFDPEEWEMSLDCEIENLEQFKLEKVE